MPLYQFNHVTPLTAAEREALVARITAMHTRKFATATFLVNVSFVNVSHVVMYHGGREDSSNSAVCFLRPESRGRGAFDEVCLEVLKAWNEVVVDEGGKGESNGASISNGASNGNRKLGAVFVQATVHAAWENGFSIPPGGQDRQWLKKIRPEAEKRAAAGDETCRFLIEELDTRPDLA